MNNFKVKAITGTNRKNFEKDTEDFLNGLKHTNIIQMQTNFIDNTFIFVCIYQTGVSNLAIPRRN